MNAIDIASLPPVSSPPPPTFRPGHYSWHEGRARYVAFLAKTVARYTKGPVLDVGCGMGYFLEGLAEIGVAATGFDISEEAVEYASRRSGDGVIPHDATMPWPYRDGSFGAVTMFDVIEHLPGYDLALSEAYRVLASFGRIFVVTVNWSSVLRVLFGSKWGGLQDPEHVVYFDRKLLGTAMRKQGFEIEEFHTVFNLSVAGESADFLLPFRRPGILIFLPELGDSIYAVGQKP